MRIERGADDDAPLDQPRETAGARGGGFLAHQLQPDAVPDDEERLAGLGDTVGELEEALPELSQRNRGVQWRLRYVRTYSLRRRRVERKSGRAGELDEARERRRHVRAIGDAHRTLRDQSRDREAHRDAVVAAAVDRAATQRAAADAGAVGGFVDGNAETAQALVAKISGSATAAEAKAAVAAVSKE